MHTSNFYVHSDLFLCTVCRSVCLCVTSLIGTYIERPHITLFDSEACVHQPDTIGPNFIEFFLQGGAENVLGLFVSRLKSAEIIARNISGGRW